MKILIADDEPIARARVRRMLGRIEGVTVVGEADNGASAVELALELHPDVLLLDIEMPGKDGLAVAEDERMPPIVFTTAHPRFALEAFELGAHDYLLKPIDAGKLARALERVRERSAAPPPEPAFGPEPWRLVVSDGALKRFVDAREVDCFLADQKYVAFRWQGHELLVRESLDRLETQLSALGFLRVNRGALVRRDAIVAFDARDGASVVLAGEQRIPVSRRAASAVREALGI
ncbi:MAG: LytR/AlgR family response regulator transcription factor [Sandaracinaceae bacterium]